MSHDMRFTTMCDLQSLRPACTYAQSYQSLCLSLEYSMTVKLLTEHHLEFLSLKGGCTGSSESTLVKMPHCWKSHVTAQMLLIDLIYYTPCSLHHYDYKICSLNYFPSELIIQVNVPGPTQPLLLSVSKQNRQKRYENATMKTIA